MTEADDDMFAGMIREALNAREIPDPIADESDRLRSIVEKQMDQEFKEQMERLHEGKPAKAALCPCGSRQYPYNLFDHKGRLLLLCCHVCEKERRKQLNDDGETLTSEG